MKLTAFAIIGTLVMTSSIALTVTTAAAQDRNAIIEAALAGGDVEAGEKIFKKCKACHMIGEDARDRTGPVLTEIVGTALGVAEGFKYSNGMIEHAEAGEVWTIENLEAFLLKPRDFIEKTKMSFSGLRKPEDRANMIAYLASFATPSE